MVEIGDLLELVVLLVLVDSEALLVLELAGQEEGQGQEILREVLEEGLGLEALEGLELELVLVQMEEDLVLEG